MIGFVENFSPRKKEGHEEKFNHGLLGAAFGRNQKNELY